MNQNTTLSKSLQMAAADLRSVRPTKADQKRNKDIDVMAVWLDDIEHTIKCKDLAPEQAEAFRAACKG